MVYCTVDNCERVARSASSRLCNTHYQRQFRKLTRDDAAPKRRNFGSIDPNELWAFVKAELGLG